MSVTYSCGKVGITPQGAWSSATAYDFLDLVTYNGSSYLAVNTSGVTAGTSLSDSDNWLQVVSKGDTGVGIASVTQTTTSTADEGINVVTVTLEDGTTSTFNVRNGSKGSTGATGNGIQSVYLVGTSGAVNTYCILFTDGTTYNFDVTDGEVTQAQLDATNAEVTDLKSAFSDNLPSVETSGSLIEKEATKATSLKSATVDIDYTANGYTSTTLFSCGKNLFDVDSFAIGKNWNGGDVAARACLYYALPYGTYMLSAQDLTQTAEITAGCAPSAFPASQTGFSAGTLTSSGRAITINATTPYLYIFCRVSSGSITQAIIEAIGFQIEVGSTITTYVAPSITKHTVTFSGTYYGGNVDFTGGVVTTKYASDGTELVTPTTESITEQNVSLISGDNVLFSADGTINIEEYKKVGATNLVICGSDATDFQKATADYVCEDGELESGINTLIDSYMSVPCTIKFFGTIRTSEGIHKHPLHNLDGYDCTLKMGDSLGSDYDMCIKPTSGGVSFSDSQIIDHNYTYVKGFSFDGNCANNMSNGSYSYNSIYGGVMCGEIYNSEVSPYNQTQLCSNILVEDISIVNSMRGIIPCIGWICRNMVIGDAMTDHAIYLAGSDSAIVENAYIYGTHKNHALCVSDSCWDATRKVKNVRIRNITFDECTGGLIDVRGHSVQGNANKNDLALSDVFMDNIYIIGNTNSIGSSSCWFGSASSNTGADYTDATTFPYNIVVKNMTLEGKFAGGPIVIYNARIKFEDLDLRPTSYAPSVAPIRIQSTDVIKRSIDLSGFKIDFTACSISATANNIIEFNRDNANYVNVNGLNLRDATIEGNNNCYLFGLLSGSGTVTLSDVNTNNMYSTALATINPNDTAELVISQ